MSLRRATVVLLVATLTATGAAGCNATPPPEPQGSPTPSAASPSPALPGQPGDASPSQPNDAMPPVPQPTSPAAATAAKCQDRPTPSEIITLLRQQDAIATDPRIKVSTGPLCVGDWQYTVMDIPNADPLQVVTRLTDGKLVYVTAGTDICDELAGAPPAIRTAAHCSAR